jgi:hypothetical protein
LASPLGATPPPGKKRAWPLLLLAGLSFVPGLGLFFGAAAVTWALISDRPRAKLSVVIAGTGTLLNLVVPLLFMLTMQHGEPFTRAEAEQTRRDLAKLVVELEHYHDRTGRYPPSLQVLVGIPVPTRLINIYDHTPGLFGMPRVYEYHPSAEGSDYDLFSAGPDGVPHTADDIRPELTDSLRQRAGYRPAP